MSAPASAITSVLNQLREEYLAWAKGHALRILESGHADSAVKFMLTALDDYPDLRANDSLRMLGALFASKGDSDGLRRWIEGFR